MLHTAAAAALFCVSSCRLLQRGLTHHPGLSPPERGCVEAVHDRAPQQLEGVGVQGNGEDPDLGVGRLGLEQEWPAGIGAVPLQQMGRCDPVQACGDSDMLCMQWMARRVLPTVTLVRHKYQLQSNKGGSRPLHGARGQAQRDALHAIQQDQEQYVPAVLPKALLALRNQLGDVTACCDSGNAVHGGSNGYLWELHNPSEPLTEAWP